MSRQEEYRAYLRSQEWNSLSLLARMRAGNACEFCGAYGDHVHHVKYPKRFSEDHIDNLIVVCAHHHELLHGIRGDFMNGTMIVVEGVDVQDGFMDFRQLYASLYESTTISGGEHYNAVFDRGLQVAWNQIFQEYKRIEKVPGVGGRMENRLWVNVSGAAQLAGKYDSGKTKAFQSLLFGKIIPAIVNTGRYDATDATLPDDPVDRQLAMIENQARAVRVMRADQLAMQAKQDAMAEEQSALKARQSRLEQKIESEVQRLDQYTGGDFYETARLACIKHGIKPTEIYRGHQTMAMVLGAWASKEAVYRGINSGPKLQEGTFLVNQYPPELLAEGICALKLQSASTH
jgi:hypothetical protein